MGNTPSSEQARRTPQRLSKPRLGQLTNSNNLLSPQAASAPNFDTRLSDTNNDTPPPLPTPETNDVLPAEFHAISNEEVTRADPALGERPNSPPEKDKHVPRFATSPLPPEKVARRKSTGIIPSATRRSLPRPKSAILRSDTVPLTSSVGGDKPSRRKSHYDLGSAAAQTILSTSPREYRGFSPVVGSGAAQFDDGNSSLQNGKDASEEQALEALIGSSRSEATLYPPTRRRSAIMTPGVATRSETEPVLNSKKSFRKSLSAAAEASRPTSSEPKVKRRTSMPPQPSFELPERGATPTESPFRQLGGMKFGSLHITNGAPVASPRPESKHKTLSTEITKDEVLEVSDGVKPSVNLSPIIADGQSESNQPTPVNGGLSPAAAVFGEPSTSIGETPSETRYSPFSPDKSGDVSPFTQPSSTGDGEILGDQDGKASSTNSKPQTPTTSSDGVARSDSGNGSVSSAKSQAALSKADSGYGSSLSLKSLFGSRKKAKQAKEEKERQAAKAAKATAEGLDRRPTLKHHSPFKPQSQDAADGVDADQSSPKVQATETQKKENRESRLSFGARLGSFKARKSQEAKAQKTQPVAEPPVPDIKQDDTPSEPAVTPEANEELEKPKKLKKLINNPRRRSMPTMPATTDNFEAVPSMPSDAEAKLQEHSRNFDKLSKRFSLRMDSSKDRPDSMIHVESKEITDPAVSYDNAPITDRSRTPLPWNRDDDRPSRASSVRSFRPPSVSSVRKMRKSRQMHGDPYDSDDDEIPETMGGYESQAASITNIRRSIGNSAFDAGFLALAADNPYAAAGAQPGPPARPKTPPNQGPGPYPRLRPRRSAPDFLETVSEPASPGSVDCWSQKKPKTPPPVTIRTRGSKKKRRPKSMQPGGRPPPMPHPPMPGQFIPMPHGDQDGPYGYGHEQDLTQSLRGYPPAGYGPPRGESHRQQFHGPPPGRRPPPARPMYPSMGDDLMGRYPPPQHQTGPMPPFHHPMSPRGFAGEDGRGGERRVLHSYNSPAYKGVPIWS